MTNLKDYLDRLNGTSTTLVWLEEDSFRLFVGGGPDRLSVEWFDERASCSLVGDSEAEGVIEIVIGGQLVDWPARLLVERPTAEIAAVAFMKDRGRASGFLWECH